MKQDVRIMANRITTRFFPINILIYDENAPIEDDKDKGS